MFDDLRQKAVGDSGATKPNNPVDANFKPDAFDQILRHADIGTRRSAEKILDKKVIELPASPFSLDLPYFDDKNAIEIEQEKVDCDKAVLPSKYLRSAVLPIRDNLVNSAREAGTNWLDDLGKVDELPSWFTTRNDGDLFAQNGLPLASRSTLPDWMTEHDPEKDDQNNDLSEFRWDPEVNYEKDDKKFDPNKTQKVKAYNKQKRAYITLVVLILYFAFTLFAGSFFTFRVDEMISSLLGVYLYTIAQEHGYDLKFLLPRKK